MTYRAWLIVWPLVCLSLVGAILAFGAKIHELNDQNESLKKDNVELAKRVLEWEKCAKHVLMQAQPE